MITLKKLERKIKFYYMWMEMLLMEKHFLKWFLNDITLCTCCKKMLLMRTYMKRDNNLIEI